MTSRPVNPRAPAATLLFGLVVTLGAVVAYSWYVTRQISRLEELQHDLIDRNRRDSLQLLRIQNNLNSLGLAMRDMLDGDQPYPLTAWSAQFERIRLDLDDALRREEAVAPASRTEDQRRYLANSFAQFWDAVEQVFALARQGNEEAARAQISMSLQARQAALSGAVARLLVANNESEEQAAVRIAAIYAQVRHQAYWFLTATLVAIVLTSAYLIRSNRRLFAAIASLSHQRHELAQMLIATRESTLRHIARELHDEFGQILTALGSMLARAGKHAPDGSPLRAELREVAEVTQAALEKVRGLSQTLHPAILEEAGLERTIEWYLSTVERQSGITISYERQGPPLTVDATTSIHVYRVLQEALSNVVRHSDAAAAVVRLRSCEGALEMDIQDRGRGLDPAALRRGLGIIAMRERAELLGGTIAFERPAEGGTLVRLNVPLDGRDSHGG